MKNCYGFRLPLAPAISLLILDRLIPYGTGALGQSGYYFPTDLSCCLSLTPVFPYLLFYAGRSRTADPLKFSQLPKILFLSFIVALSRGDLYVLGF